MNNNLSQHRPWAIVIGDAVMHLIITLFGFASHDTLQPEFLNRILATFAPFFIAWLVSAFLFGLFSWGRIKDPRQLWRPPLAAIIAAPVGGIVRGLWLRSTILPTFILVMAGVTAVGMFVWRSLLLLLFRRLERSYRP
jgi:hypothetical protein